MFNDFYGGWWDYWQLYHSVTFDGPNKLIWVNDGVISLDVKEDLYSDWKEWVILPHVVNAAYLPAISAVGGQPLPGGRFVGSTYFLENGWRIKPYQGAYRLTVNGNLFTTEGDNPVVDADGLLNNIMVEFTVSTLVETISIAGDTLTADDITSLTEGVWTETLSQYTSAGTAGQIIDKTGKLAKLIPGAL